MNPSTEQEQAAPAAPLGMAPEPTEDPTDRPRLSLPTPARIATAGGMAFLLGMGLGATHGGRMAELRFRAEHAHKLPTSTPGWYLYHKSKNYHAAYGGIKEGLRVGPRLALWVMVALGLESAVDSSRRKTDLVSTVLASLTAAGGFSLWNRFNLSTSARVAKSAFLFGLGYGALQDGLALLHGQRIGYVEFVRNGFRFSQPVPDERVL